MELLLLSWEISKNIYSILSSFLIITLCNILVLLFLWKKSRSFRIFNKFSISTQRGESVVFKILSILWMFKCSNVSTYYSSLSESHHGEYFYKEKALLLLYYYYLK